MSIPEIHTHKASSQQPASRISSLNKRASKNKGCFTLVILDKHRHSLPQRRAVAQGILNLAQLDPEAPQLHLVIQPPQKFQHSIWQPSRQVTCGTVMSH